MPEDTLRVEFLLADEDGTWRTVIHTVPVAQLDKATEAGDDELTLCRWAREHLADQCQYRRIVLWALYAVLEDEGPKGWEEG